MALVSTMTPRGCQDLIFQNATKSEFEYKVIIAQALRVAAQMCTPQPMDMGRVGVECGDEASEGAESSWKMRVSRRGGWERRWFAPMFAFGGLWTFYTGGRYTKGDFGKGYSGKGKCNGKGELEWWQKRKQG